MPKREVTTETIGKPIGVFSQATMIEAEGRLVFISGMVARRPDGTVAGVGDVAAQTVQVCENVKAAVEAAGGTMADVVSTTTYITGRPQREVVTEVRHGYFPGPDHPCNTLLIVSGLGLPDYLVEIEAVAWVRQ